MTTKIFLFSFVGVVSSIIVGCTAEPVAAEDESQGITADAITVVGAIECNPRTERGCDRGDSCLGVNIGRNDTKYVCAANRCLEQDDCRAGYSCRVNHCIALEREEVRRDLRDVDARRLGRHEVRDELSRREAAAAAAGGGR